MQRKNRLSVWVVRHSSGWGGGTAAGEVGGGRGRGDATFALAAQDVNKDMVSIVSVRQPSFRQHPPDTSLCRRKGLCEAVLLPAASMAAQHCELHLSN
ncbi:hypothetical protein E2C01_005082 [Portunus trituberculatus]|uniref:Uncharacterized protein n=1 Tax=Portunus trituberculatus TaxID=210409 RepID=A0A5B7CRP5_PORTR|nr:hypothetical protein [Portunus trituberculatus]